MHSTKRNLLVLALVLIFIGVIFFRVSGPASGITNREEFNQQIRNSLAELQLPKQNNSLLITGSADRLSDFIYYRSGASLSTANKETLRQSEQLFWNESKRVSQQELAQILTDVAFEKLVTLSDQDVDNVTDILRGFNDPSMPAAFQAHRNKVTLRANGEGTMDPQYFAAQLKYARDAQIDYNQNGRGSYPPLLVQTNRAALYNRIVNDVSNRVASLSAADPDTFESSKSDLTPVQAILVAYSVASSDLLAGNQAELQQKMSERQQAASQFAQAQYPSPQGHRAFGVNGYIYSSPLNYLFDDMSVRRVLDLINERRAQ